MSTECFFDYYQLSGRVVKELAIPNQMMDGQQIPYPTSEFKKIIYGQFYDLTNNVG